MPARLNRPVRDRIVQLHEQGLRFKEIAAELGVSPATVAKYCKDADAGSVMAASPAAQFTDHEVQWLKAVAANATQDGCSKCGKPMLSLFTMAEGVCPYCGTGWARDKRASSGRGGSGRRRRAQRSTGRRRDRGDRYR